MKRNKNYILPFLISIWIFPTLASTDGKLTIKKFGKYTVLLSQDFKGGLGKIVIKKGGNKVFKDSNYDNHYFFGNDFDEQSNGKDPFSGRDLTGNGIPDLVVSNWSGGAHCCNFVHIFELGKKIKEIATVEAQSSSVHLVDLDHDGYPEIEFWDGAIDYIFACFAGSPGGRVILKFQKDHYEVATQIMKKPAPSAAQIKIFKNKIRAAFKDEGSPDLPYEFLNLMMDLSYSGHFKLAMKMASEMWPEKKPGLSKFKEDFAQALHDSPYWRYF